MKMDSNCKSVIETRICISLSNSYQVLSVSDGMYELLGFEADDFVSSKISLQKLIHIDDQDIADYLFLNEQNPNTQVLNIRIRHADGRIRCIKATFDKALNTTTDGVVLDLLLQDAKSLWHQQGDQTMMANFRAMMDNTDDYIYFKDRHHVFTGASQALVEVTKSTHNWTEFLGLTDYDVFLEEYADIYYKLEKEVFAGVSVAHEIQETLYQDGTKGWVSNRKYPIKNEDGEIIGLFGIARDITGQVLAEQALRKSEESLREAQDVAELGSYSLDIATETLHSNYILKQLFGISNLQESSLSVWLSLIHPDDRAGVERHLRIDVLANGGAFKKEFRILRESDQAERWVNVLGKLEFNAKGEPVRLHGTVQDTTEKHEEILIEKRSILSNQLVGVLTLKNRQIIWANPAFEKMMGYESGELVSKPTRQFYVTEEDYLAVENTYDEMMRDGVGHTQHIYLRKDGEKIWVDMSATLVNPQTGESLWAYVDITKYKLAESELRIAAAAFESQEGMFITDACANILRVNKAFTRITGYAPQDVIGQTPRILSSGRHDASFYAAMWTGIRESGGWEGEVWNRRKNGEVYPEQLAISTVRSPDGVVTNYVAALADITVSKAAAEKIEQLAFFDPLTNLPNRRLLLDRLSQGLASSGRSGNAGGILFIDMDDFKTLNDTLGHDMGDLLLKEVALRLSACLRNGDTVARIGGDEFVVLIEELSEDLLEAASQTEIVANKIIESLNQPYQLVSREYHSTPSIGATIYLGHQLSVDELLKQADIAMYQSKKSGRNQLNFFDPKMQAKVISRAELELELHKALELNQFQLHYQPQVNEGGNLLGAEALIRWIHPKRGMVSPFDFIPLAEETGLILPIGQWVLESACAQLKLWERSELTRRLTISINVSAKQLSQPDFVKQIQKALKDYDVPPNRLKLELTEGLLLENINETIVTMIALETIGVMFSIDDFGTGYSSLQYLKMLPLNQLKIDQSFVRDIVHDASDKSIVRTIIAMAKSLSFEVIAEGVETEDQRALLFNKGCKQYQGYLFGKPVPINEFDEKLRSTFH